MKAFWFALLLVWLAWPAAGQAFLVESRPLPARSYQQLERARQSVAHPNGRNYFKASGFRLGQPLMVVLRQPKTIPRTQIQYFYSLPDSLVRAISIEIDSLNFPEATYKAAQPYRESPARQAVFAQYHQAIVAEFTTRFGPPVRNEPANKARGPVKYAERTTTWDTPDLTADVYSIFTIQTTDVATYRVRANISYKNQNAAADKATLSSPNPVQARISQQFATLLVQGQYLESWQLLSPDIRQALTYEQYMAQMQAFVASLDQRHREVTALMSSPVFNSSGTTYYRYAYAIGKTHKSATPEKMLSIVFKDATTQEISGVQPQTLSAKVPVRVN